MNSGRTWIWAAVMLAAVGQVSFGQTPAGQASSGQNSTQQQSTPPPVFKATTRLVTLQVLARDKQGKPVTGLTAKDFQVYEDVPPKKDKRAQQIADFQAVSIAQLAAADKGKVQLPAGVYTNLVTLDKKPVPPTVLLIDGLNTSLKVQGQVHRQMVKMLGTIPQDVPVAVFLLGSRLALLQDFTTDPALLKAAAAKATSLDSAGNAEVDPQDDPEMLSAQLWDVPGAPVAVLQQFERETYAQLMDIRVDLTLGAFRAIARHLSGYPGRKNLLWVSSSFPIQLSPDFTSGFAGQRNYDERMVEVANALSDAKVAVYPLDAGGVEVQASFGADRAARGGPLTGKSMGATIARQDTSRFSKQESMGFLADGTGGRKCVGDNDLADCVKKSMDDGGSYYELAYYPDTTNWNGEFHRITVKTTQPGITLAYRRGYYAAAGTHVTDSAQDAKMSEKELRQAACDDLLTSTSLLVVARAMPSDQPNQAKFYMAIDSKDLTFEPVEGGGRKLRMASAVCTFDKKGNALQYFSDRSEQTYTDKEFTEARAKAVPHAIQFPPAEGTTRVRLVVRDAATAQMGSVDVPYAAAVAAGNKP